MEHIYAIKQIVTYLKLQTNFLQADVYTNFNRRGHWRKSILVIPGRRSRNLDLVVKRGGNKVVRLAAGWSQKADCLLLLLSELTGGAGRCGPGSHPTSGHGSSPVHFATVTDLHKQSVRYKLIDMPKNVARLISERTASIKYSVVHMQFLWTQLEWNT